jgi:hypothetical protein
MKLLKQGTAVTIKLGPFLDSTDGVTAKTALTLAQADILISKQFGAFAQKNSATSATHDTAGWYGVPLDTTDTGTHGLIQIHCNKSSALPVWDNYTVVNANIFNSWTQNTELQNCNVFQVYGNETLAIVLKNMLTGVVTGTTTNTGFTGTATEFECSDITEATSGHYIGKVVTFYSGALLGQSTVVTAYSLSSGRGHFTVAALTEAVPSGALLVLT